MFNWFQLCGDIAKDLKVVGELVSERAIDVSLSLWLEAGMIKPVMRLYVAVADFINLQQLLSRRCVLQCCANVWKLEISSSAFSDERTSNSERHITNLYAGGCVDTFEATTFFRLLTVYNGHWAH